jgi:hypothetical protein
MDVDKLRAILLDALTHALSTRAADVEWLPFSVRLEVADAMADYTAPFLAGPAGSEAP